MAKQEIIQGDTFGQAWTKQNANNTEIYDDFQVEPSEGAFVDGDKTALDSAVQPTATTTLTNKRITSRVLGTTSSATPTINTDNCDIYQLTAQAADITSMTTNLSGTPVEGDVLMIEITGTAARAITWGTSFEASTVALPTTTVTTAKLSVGFVYNDVTDKWRCMGVA